MSFINDTLSKVPLPKVVKIEQHFESSYMTNIEEYIENNLVTLSGYKSIEKGQSIAVTGGSRGINSIDIITKAVCDMVKKKGAYPFIVPAMGSHGGATADGQIEVLATLGITEETMGVPIKASMEVVKIGEIMNGRPVYLDKYANDADGIIVINRIKAHTSFRGVYESGLMKMMAIGLGKQLGAEHYHKTGFKYFPEIIEKVGPEVLKKKNICFGVGIIDNSYGKVSEIALLNSDEIVEKEKELLVKANSLMPRLFFDQADVLIVKESGKNISGTGMDSNIIGRFNNKHYTGNIELTKIAVLDLSEKSHGNFNGMGLADFTTKRVYDKMDFETTYPNALTATTVLTVKIPMILPTDEMAMKAAIKTCNILDLEKCRFVIIENTKNMKTVYISENMIEETKKKKIEIISEPMEIPFNKDRSLELDFS